MENVTWRGAVVRYIEKRGGDVRDMLADASVIGKPDGNQESESRMGRKICQVVEELVNQR